jgi:hypothetical protein
MDILEGHILAKNLFERYSANARDWRFEISVSERHGSFFDAIVSNPNEVWQLKIDSIYKPNPLIIGTKLDVDPIKFSNNENAFSFGYRKLDPIRLQKALDNVEDSESENKALDSFLASLITSTEPEVPRPNNSYAYGPFIFAQNSLTSVDKHQKNISDKLANRLRDKLRSLYSSYG